MIGSIGLALLCSCATTRHSADVIPASERPAEVAMDQFAGRGSHLIVKLRLENGEEFPVFVDTGAPGSLLPKSLEPTLGKRLGTATISMLDSSKEVSHIYAAPKLYLGHTLLVTGSRIGTCRHSMGTLGMDCLRHYCIQLDFEARRLRFLDPEHLTAADFGQAFPLADSPCAMINHYGLFENKTSKVWIDTGCTLDGFVKPRVFKREVREWEAPTIPEFRNGEFNGPAAGIAFFPKCVWDGQTYTGLFVGKGPNLIGLRFLGRHVVTFNFPKGMMYLKRISDSTLCPEDAR
jgi:hypothetical protein